MATSKNYSGALKRGKYVHSAFDKATDTWLYKNLINRALIEVSARDNAVVYAFLNEPNRAPSDQYESEMRDLLLGHRFLIESEIDEVSVLERQYWRRKLSGVNSSVAVVTTLQCNLRCEYCYQDHVDDTLSLSDENSIVAMVSKIAGNGEGDPDYEPVKRFSLSWWGGEPLLRIDAIERISDRIVPILAERDIEYDCYTSTNAVLLTKKNCCTLRRAGLRRAQITIDGPQEFHDAQRFNVGGRGTYLSVVRGLHNLVEELHELGRFITLRVNVTPRMIGDLSPWKSFIADLQPVSEHIAVNIHQAVPNDFFDPAGSLKNPDYLRIYRLLKELIRSSGLVTLEEHQEFRPGALYCGAIPNTNWIILPGGRVTKCTDKFHDPTSDCGRLKPDGTLELFEKAKEWLEYSPFKSKLCSSCDVLPICMGGCRVLPFESENGDRCIRKSVVEQSILSNPRRLRSNVSHI